MTTPVQETPEQPLENKQSDKENNFRLLEARYQRQLDQERTARLQAEEALAARQKQVQEEPEDDPTDPYVDHKRLSKTLNTFEKKMEEKIEKRAKEISRQEQAEDKKAQWLKNNPDFYQVLQHAEKFAESDPELAETILMMPEGFDRQKLVYKNIKALGIHLPPEQKKSSIQDKINANQQGLYYQPSGVAASPYEQVGDYSDHGKKQAYEKMMQLKHRLKGPR